MRICGLTLAVLLASACAASTQEFVPVAAIERVPSAEADALQRQIDDLQARLAAVEGERRQQALAVEQAMTQPRYVVSVPVEPAGEWIGGANLYVLKPHWSSGNDAFTTFDLGGPATLSMTPTPFSFNYQVAPGAWFGYLHSSGTGVRVNYFQFNQASTQSATSTATVGAVDLSAFIGTFAPPIPGDILTATGTLAVNHWDLEVIRRANARYWTWTASAGLRYLYVGQSYSASDVFTFSSVASRQFFNGGGPTLSLLGRRSLGSAGLGFFGSGRGSLAFGNATRNYNASVFGIPFFVSDSSNWETMPVVELEFGLDYRRQMGWATLEIESGLRGQAYFDAGSSSGLTPRFSTYHFPPGVDNSISAATLGLFGWRSSIGFRF